MKIKSLLFLSAAGLLYVAGVNATDYAPSNWRFSEMQVGSAAGIFEEQMATGKWNIESSYFQTYSNCVGLANNYPNGTPYDQMSDADKVKFRNFYESAQIVNGGSENLLCLVGKNAPDTYPGGVAFTETFPNATLFWLSGTEAGGEPNHYRLTIESRVITSATSSSMKLSLANSQYNGVKDGGYIDLVVPFGSASNDKWSKAMIDFTMSGNWPLVIKMLVSGGLVDNSVVLFRSFKLESIDAVEYDNGTVVDSEFVDNPNDEPSNVQSVFNNELIAWGVNGVISVIDANEPIEVYNAAGVLVSRVNEVSTLVNIPVSQKGVFIVKSGSVTRKVVL